MTKRILDTKTYKKKKIFPNFLWKNIEKIVKKEKNFTFISEQYRAKSRDFSSECQNERTRARFYSAKKQNTIENKKEVKMDLINSDFEMKKARTSNQMALIDDLLKDVDKKSLKEFEDLYKKAKVGNFSKKREKRFNNFSFLMIKHLERLKIFNLEESRKAEKFFNKNIEQTKPETYVIKNKEAVKNIYSVVNRAIDKGVPDFRKMKIDQIRKDYPEIKDHEIYGFYALYKSVLKLRTCLTKDLDSVRKGIDFETFLNGLPQMIGENRRLSEKIFNSINTNNDSYLSLEEFLKGISKIKSESLIDKIDLFLKVGV